MGRRLLEGLQQGVGGGALHALRLVHDQNGTLGLGRPVLQERDALAHAIDEDGPDRVGDRLRLQLLGGDAGPAAGVRVRPLEIGFLLGQHQAHVGVDQGALVDAAAGAALAARSVLRHPAEQGAAEQERRRQLPGAGRAVEHERREELIRLEGALQGGGGARLTQDGPVERGEAARAHSGAPRVARKRSIASPTR